MASKTPKKLQWSPDPAARVALQAAMESAAQRVLIAKDDLLHAYQALCDLAQVKTKGQWVDVRKAPLDKLVGKPVAIRRTWAGRKPNEPILAVWCQDKGWAPLSKDNSIAPTHASGCSIQVLVPYRLLKTPKTS